MKNIYFFLGLIAFFSLSSCVQNEEIYVEDSLVDKGNIRFEDTTNSANNANFLIYYSNLYFYKTQADGGRSYKLTLTDNFTNSGRINAKVALILDIYKPYNTNIEGTYTYLSPSGKAIDYVDYYENLTFDAGVVTYPSFSIPDADFDSGSLTISYLGSNRYFIQYQFRTLYNENITGSFEGRISQ